MSILIPAWVNGTLTPVEKLEAHRRGLRHKAVSVFVIRDGEILLQQRALGKYHTPGLWANTCCTHPDWGESAADCANRRLSEELGIAALTPEHRQRLEYRADVGNALIEHEVVDVFVAHAPAGLRVMPEPSEVMATRWVTPASLMAEIKAAPDRFTPWLKIYMTEHAVVIFRSDLANAATA